MYLIINTQPLSMYSLTTTRSFCIIYLLIFLGSIGLYGEGSVNFITYPGHRLFYNASEDQQLKVYVGSGEFINIGASHLGIRGGFIAVYRPDGSLYATFDGSDGLGIINNNIEEINGPTGGGTTQGAGYIPAIVEVQEADAGIWTVILDYPEHSFDAFNNILNNAPWTRTADQPDNARVILSWDITVSTNAAGNENGLLQSGRVYSNEYVSILNRNNVTTNPIFYVLTKDGFQYSVNFNQTDPFSFPLSANNRGVVFGNGASSYQSARLSELTINNNITTWDPSNLYLYPPQERDSLAFINHKIFFNPPDPNMPSRAKVSEIFQSTTYDTWLYNLPREVVFDASNIFEPYVIECSDDSYVVEAAYISFESSHEALVEVFIDVNNNSSFEDPEDVKLSTFTSSPKDSILWNGLDGLGNTIHLLGDTILPIELKIKTGEIHIFNQDVENDLGGLTINRINGDNAPQSSFYYDHSNVGGAVSGNGQAGNALATTEPFTYSNNFGNEILFDYWAFAISKQQTITASYQLQKNNTIKVSDTDNDGIFDNEEIDDDKDGIEDSIEACSSISPCPFSTIDPSGDEDGDCILNYLDAADVNFQLICIDENQDGVCDILPAWLDQDGDAIPNFQDTDSDNDNIRDSDEGSEDKDLDNIPNFLDVDSDNDGIKDLDEGLKDSDSDQIPNFLDDDSDNDGIKDLDEGNVDTDLDEIPNFLDDDSDNDGIKDLDEGNVDTDLDQIPNFLDDDSDNDGIKDLDEGNVDTDLDEIPNFLDDDSDNDGIKDLDEGNVDTDLDQIPNFLDDDSDNDGIKDLDEGNVDTDLDQIPNFLDDDSDNDGIKDVDEGNVDTDLDQIPNFLDDDSDNDGIKDLDEGNVDTDLDQIPNFLDDDSDNDGIKDLDEGIVDTDLDQIPNFLDDDSDNDGIKDLDEGIVDTDLDQIPNFLDDDSDNDGIKDLDEGNVDTDLDQIPNFLDDDSDNDGIKDLDEGNEDTDLDQIPNFLDDDSDNDGIKDVDEGNVDTDLDQIPNFLDDDSDNDGIKDVDEGNVDTDLDQIPNFLDDDSDNDGIKDLDEGNIDTDLDQIPNFLDDDSDNDGIKDVDEGNVDTDLDQIPNFLDDDSDNDGIKDLDEGNVDTDLDQIPNFLDDDSDNDGIKDLDEGNIDTDLDQIPNFLDDDSDNDDIKDLDEGNVDNDLDEIPNFLDDDSDNDGIKDVDEGNVDTDLDQIPNFLDDDSDNDGIKDVDEGNVDTDLDQIPNFLDEDSDNDGIKDLDEGNVDTDLDEIPNFLDEDSDNDGIKDLDEGNLDTDGDTIPNFEDADSDNDGIPDSMEKENDTDGDTIPNYLDLDSDNDGINDVIELGAVDANGDGQADGNDFNQDGLVDNPPAIPDNDNDSIPNYLDLDSDNDGLLDIIENGLAIEDTNGDGMADGDDQDMDGILSSVDDNDMIFGEDLDTPIKNTDNTDQPDYLDTDSDNDGVTDIEENGNKSLDTDQDGMIDPPYIDNDGDGLPMPIDGNDTVFGNFHISDPDGDGKENAIDLDDDNDGIRDEIEVCQLDPNCPLLGLDPSGDEDQDSIPNYLDADDPSFILNCVDENEDGECDYPTIWIDSDQDNVPNHLDLDSDNDAISDITEAGFLELDADGNGRIDGLIDSFQDGLFINLPTDTVVDTDQDGIYNFLDIDGDNDGIFDLQEGQYRLVDLDNNGRIDNTSRSNLVNEDGVGDVIEGGNFFRVLDSDNDGYYNAIDADSDNDGVGDVIEGGNLDINRDGFIGGASLVVNLAGQVESDGLSNSYLPYLRLLDSDNDGYPNFIDLDSDNDGIGDVIEGGAALLVAAIGGNGDVIEGGNLDADRDGFLGTAPLTYNNLGQPIDDNSDLIFNLNAAPLDSDGDGVANMVDLDSDNDGVGDVIEGGAALLVAAIGGNGDVIEGGNLDADRDGFLGTAPLIYNDLGQPIDDNSDLIFIINAVPLDTDSDGYYNAIDGDSDNDGVGDVIEGGAALLVAAIGGNGDVIEGGNLDADRDGFLGTAPLTYNSLGQPIDDNSDLIFNLNALPLDSDNDGVLNIVDLDSDNDGIGDVIEGGAALLVANTGGVGDVIEGGNLARDQDRDGFLGASPLITNQLGHPIRDANNLEFVLHLPPIDTDGDRVSNLIDSDSDNDGVGDVIEGGNLLQNEDTGGVGDVIEGGNLIDPDGDGYIGASDVALIMNNFGQPVQSMSVLLPINRIPEDTDGDGIDDLSDLDSDDDGINDVLEAGGTDEDGNGLQDGSILITGSTGVFLEVKDQDGDGISDFLDLDSDGDGLSDLYENGGQTSDSNEDGLVDGIDTDQDGIKDLEDGLPNEFGDKEDAGLIDSDGDGIWDILDLDVNGDGVWNIIENGLANLDEDNNGIIDDLTDLDKDGIPDIIDVKLDTFGGITGPGILINTDNDAIPNQTDLDSDNDGISDTLEIAFALNDGDTDQDGIPDHLDLDSDNDGLNDVYETGGIDENGDGMADGQDENLDGIIDTPPMIMDSDMDGIPNHIDLDSDNDGLLDIVENGYAQVDTNRDGMADGSDEDQDGIRDAVDNQNSIFGEENDLPPTNSDGLDNPDFLDSDSDNDGLTDIKENGQGHLDSNGDGLADEPFIDENRDGISDAFPLPYLLLDTDQDSILNHIDTDSDNDSFSDLEECPTPENCPDFDQDGIPDYLDNDCNQLSIPQITLTATDTLLCTGGTTELMAINTNPSTIPISYVWMGVDKILITEKDSQADTFAITLSNVDNSSEGYYRFSIQSQQGVCSIQEDSIYISVLTEAELQPILSIENDSICPGSDVLLSANLQETDAIDSYNWYFLKDSTRTLLSNTKERFLPIIEIDQTAIGEYQVEAISSACGIYASNLQSLYVFENQFKIKASSDIPIGEVICTGNSVTFTTESIANARYQWITPIGDTIAGRTFTIETASINDMGNYFAKVEIANCITNISDPIALVVSPMLLPPVIEAQGPTCLGTPMTLNIQNPLPEAQYDWYKNDSVFIARTSSPTLLLSNQITAAEAGKYTVLAVAASCESPLSEPITIAPIDPFVEQAIAGTDQTLCAQTSIQLSGNIPTSGTGYWTALNNLTTAILNDPTPIVPLEIGVNAYVWTIQHPQCSTSTSDTIYIDNQAKPSIFADAGMDKTLCQENELQLEATPIPNDIQGTWTSTNPVIIEQVNASNTFISNLQTGENQLIWTLSTALCPAFSRDTLNITLNPPPTEIANAGEDQNVCQENTIELTAAAPLNSKGQWLSLDGNIIANPQSNRTLVSPLQEGTHQFVWSLSTTQCPNFSSDTITITSSSPPQDIADAGTDQQVCTDMPLSLNATLPTLTTGIWTSTQGQLIENNTAAQATLQTIQEGTNLLIWTLSYESCINYDSDTLVITKIAPPTEVAFAGPDQQVCNLSEVPLNARQGINAIGSWQLQEGIQYQNIQNPSTTISNLQEGNKYDLIWSLSTDLCGNFSQDTVQITIDTIPTTNAIILLDEFESTPSPTNPMMPDGSIALCDPQTILLEAILPENQIGTWQSNNNITLDQQADGRVLISKIADQNLQLTWSLSQNTCLNYSTDTINIDLIKADGLQAESDTYEMFFNEAITNIDLVENDLIPEEMSWNFSILEEPEGTITNLGDGFINFEPRNNFFGTDQFVYELCHASCPELCDTAAVNFNIKGITKDKECFISNIITPNGDGLNDRFIVPCLSEYPDLKVSIFNRWGNEVFTAAPYRNDWEGTYKQNPLPDGTYFYIIALTDYPLDQLSGYFTIVQ